MWPFKQRDQTKLENTRPDQEPLRALSVLMPQDVQSLGALPGEAVCGFMSGNNDSVEHFRPNRVFIDLMHSVIRTAGPYDISMVSAAAQQQEGWLYVIDLRTPDGPQGEVPAEDIIGAFEVKDGLIVADSYWANDQHQVFSVNGLVQLPPSLHDALVQAIRDRHSYHTTPHQP
jgi:hypothetical protein